jgi:hypothetical protein
VREIGALSDLDNITVRIADVAANLAVLGNRFREELGSSTFPQFIARLNIRDADIHKTTDLIRVGDAERYRRLVGGRPAPDVDKEPHIRDLNVPGRAAAVASAIVAGNCYRKRPYQNDVAAHQVRSECHLHLCQK